MEGEEKVVFKTSLWYVPLGGKKAKGLLSYFSSMKKRVHDFPVFTLIKDTEDKNVTHISVSMPSLTRGDDGDAKNFSFTRGKDYEFEFVKYDGIIGFLFNAGTILINTPQWGQKPRIYEWVLDPTGFARFIGYDNYKTRAELLKIRVGMQLGWAVMLALLISTGIFIFYNQLIGISLSVLFSVLGLTVNDLFFGGKNFTTVKRWATSVYKWVVDKVNENRKKKTQRSKDKVER